MSDFCYNVLALIPVETDFRVANVVETFIADGQPASLATSPAGSCVGFRVVYTDNWGIVAWFEDDVDIVTENQEIMGVFGNPPNVAADATVECDRRLSIWSDDDSDMMNAHLFEEYIGFLKEKLGLYIFDSVQGIWR